MTAVTIEEGIVMKSHGTPAHPRPEQGLLDQLEFAPSLVHHSTAPTFVIDTNHKVLVWNRALQELTGIKAQDVLGTDEHWRALDSAG